MYTVILAKHWLRIIGQSLNRQLELLWYGFRNKQYSKNIYKLRNKKNKLSRQYARPYYYNVQINKQNFRTHKPFGWDLIMLKGKQVSITNVFMASSAYVVNLPLPSSLASVSFDPNTSVIKLHSLYVNNNYRLFWGVLREALKSFYSPAFLKIKFKGKGYYIYKNKRNTITPQFGYAHRLYLYSYFVSVRFLSKTSILIFGFTHQDLVKVGLGIKAMRPINIFTGRGVRFSKQIIYKKVGKVSSYR